MYRCDNVGLSGSLKRLTCVRFVNDPEKDKRFYENQCRTVGVGPLFKHYARRFRALLRNLVFCDTEVLRNDWVDTPHPKKKERVQGRENLVTSGRRSHHIWVYEIEYKSKPGEFLPKNKYLRGIGDATVHGAARCAYLMPFVKQILSMPYITNNRGNQCRFQFLPTPTLSEIRDLFQLLVEPSGMFFFDFSDDICISAKCVDGYAYFNGDLVKADSSYYDPIFNFARDCISVVPYVNDIDALLKQLKLIYYVRCCLTREKFKLKPTVSRLPSGNSGTTNFNVFAVLSAYIVAKSKYNRFITKAQFRQMLLDSFEECGLEIDLVDVVHIEDFQFLKMSPIRTEYGLEPIVNLAVWLKGFGTIAGDLPGRNNISLAERAYIFNCSVVKSREHWGNHMLSSAFRRRFPHNSKCFTIEPDYNRPIGESHGTCLDESLCLRYRCTTSELHELCEAILSSKFGDKICLPIIDKIFQKDYGFNRD